MLDGSSSGDCEVDVQQNNFILAYLETIELFVD